ncbi:MAG: N-acetylmuramoyl-L-alanine amidase family protein [Trebonia sp.]
MIALVACGACVLAAGVVALSADAAGYSRSTGSASGSAGSAVGPAMAPGSGGGAETAGLSSPRAIDPGLFSSSACMAFPPTGGDRHETVFLDAGHGGIDPGGVGTTQAGASVSESMVNLDIELDAMGVLRAQGYRVVVSRTRNTTVTKLTPGDTDGGLLTSQGVRGDVAARDVCANMAGATVLVGIYMDSGSPWNAGCVTGYDQDRPFAADNQRLANLLQSDVLDAMNAHGWDIPNEGVQPDTQLGSATDAAAESYDHLMLLGPSKAGYFATPSQMPGALIEPLFLTDPFEASIAASTHGQQVIASALAKAIKRYLPLCDSNAQSGVPRRARLRNRARGPLPARGRLRSVFPGQRLVH